MRKNSQEEFEGIMNLRKDEIPDHLLIYYQSQIIRILLSHTTWVARVKDLKNVWSGVMNTIEVSRRQKKTYKEKV